VCGSRRSVQGLGGQHLTECATQTPDTHRHMNTVYNDSVSRAMGLRMGPRGRKLWPWTPTVAGTVAVASRGQAPHRTPTYLCNVQVRGGGHGAPCKVGQAQLSRVQC
jgi:hypothetical protein